MLRSLQACRAVAALLVVLLHTSQSIFALPKYFGHKPFGPIFDFGFAGVDFFFVLSGFLMMHVHAADFGQPRKLGAYLWKRFTRIYPAYWVVFAAILPVLMLIPSFGLDCNRDPDVALRAFFLFPHPQSYQVVGVAWTLVYEIFFYCLFALLVLNKRIGALVFFAWAACIVVQPGLPDFPWSFLFSQQHLRFLAGIGVAFILARWQLPFPRAIAVTGVIVFFGAGMLDAYFGPIDYWLHLMGYTLGSAFMLAGLVQAERSGLLHPPSWLVYLGNASYAIYLVHFFALSITAKAAMALHLDLYVPSTILFGLFVVIAVGAGCVFHHLVEKPLHQWTKRYFVHAEPRVHVTPSIREAARHRPRKRTAVRT
jgi:exopolysaccharide production protein ExoZ